MCRQYRNTKVRFMNSWFYVSTGTTEESFPVDNYDIDDVCDWLAKNATPKGRRGSGTKPRNKTASISFRFTESEVANLDALAVRLKTNRTDAMNVAVATMLDSVSGQSPE